MPEAYYRQTVDAFGHARGQPERPAGHARIDQAGTPPPEPAAEAGSDGPSLAQQLKGLGELCTQGVLTEEEFAAAKKRLIEGHR